MKKHRLKYGKCKDKDMYTHGKISQTHVKDPLLLVRVRWIMELLKWTSTSYKQNEKQQQKELCEAHRVL